MTQEQENEAIELLLALLRQRVSDNQRRASPDLVAARRIAADRSKQSGKNVANFLSGRYDHAFGIQCVLAGIEYGRRSS